MRETGLPSFGEKLKQEREKRKITLEQISESTKIGTRMLQALEEDKFDQLPGGIFNKGFVRAYSRFLELDEDQIVADYLQASGDAPPPRTEIALRADEARENEQNISRLEEISDRPRPLPWGLFAALLLLIALALSLWSRRQREHARQSLRPAVVTQPTAPLPSDAGKATNTTTDKMLDQVSEKRSGSPSPPSGATAADLSKPVSPTSFPPAAVSSTIDSSTTGAAKTATSTAESASTL